MALGYKPQELSLYFLEKKGKEVNNKVVGCVVGKDIEGADPPVS